MSFPHHARPWRPSRVVSLLTDFGERDHYVGVMKGVLLRALPQVVPVDLCHGVAAQAILHASWLLAHSWRYFPAGSVHLAVVDPGVGSARRILVAEQEGHAFLAPDNGLLGPVLRADARVLELDLEVFALPGRSATFHGRDVFAPAAAALAGGLDPARAGRPVEDWQRASFPEVTTLGSGLLRTEVLYADHYGNLVTPLGAERLDGGAAAWEVELGDARIPVRRTYADARPGELLALIGSSGSLEVSVREGDAARALSLGPGAAVIARRRSS